MDGERRSQVARSRPAVSVRARGFDPAAPSACRVWPELRHLSEAGVRSHWRCPCCSPTSRSRPGHPPRAIARPDRGDIQSEPTNVLHRPYGRTGLPAYADAVIDAIDRRTDVALVTQSMGAFTAPLVWQRVPTRRVVLVNAMIPAPGETPGGLVGERRLRASQDGRGGAGRLHPRVRSEHVPLARHPRGSGRRDARARRIAAGRAIRRRLHV